LFANGGQSAVEAAVQVVDLQRLGPEAEMAGAAEVAVAVEVVVATEEVGARFSKKYLQILI
jgi:hypothetical protein